MDASYGTGPHRRSTFAAPPVELRHDARSGDGTGGNTVVDDSTSPFDAAFPGPALPLDDDVRRLLIAQQRFSDAPPEPEALHQLLIELAQWVADADGAVFERIEGSDLVYSNACGLLADSVGTRAPRGGTLSDLVIATGQPQVSPDSLNDGRADTSACRWLGIGSMVLFPLRNALDTAAVVTVVSATAGRMTERHAAVLRPLLALAAARLAHVAAFNERLASDKLLATVGEGSRAILVADQPAAELCHWAARMVDAPFAVFLQPDAEGNLVTVAQEGAALAPMVLPRDKPSVMRAAFESGRLQLIADYRDHEGTSARVVEILDEAGLTDAHSGAALPVTSGGQPIGVLAMVMRDRMTAGHAAMLGLVNVLATEAGLAIERDNLQHQLEEQARTDDLTGLPNRRVWHERLALEIARSTRTKAPLSLILLDLDHFKDFNDSHGHQAGDDMLIAVARAWGGELRETDLLARLGGEEFAVLLPDTPIETAGATGKRLLHAVPRGLTASAGLAQWCGEDTDALYRRADEALYAAKAAGRNQLMTAKDEPED
ncbi:MAG: hypothetical protein QOJ03_1118 [Frankiaceae bacterium]|nr:hypothetical protein [Frankiaceae bacterium]